MARSIWGAGASKGGGWREGGGSEQGGIVRTFSAFAFGCACACRMGGWLGPRAAWQHACAPIPYVRVCRRHCAGLACASSHASRIIIVMPLKTSRTCSACSSRLAADVLQQRRGVLPVRRREAPLRDGVGCRLVLLAREEVRHHAQAVKQSAHKGDAVLQPVQAQDACGVCVCVWDGGGGAGWVGEGGMVCVCGGGGGGRGAPLGRTSATCRPRSLCVRVGVRGVSCLLGACFGWVGLACMAGGHRPLSSHNPYQAYGASPPWPTPSPPPPPLPPPPPFPIPSSACPLRPATPYR